MRTIRQLQQEKSMSVNGSISNVRVRLHCEIERRRDTFEKAHPSSD
jgi:hypothetical protein